MLGKLVLDSKEGQKVDELASAFPDLKFEEENKAEFKTFYLWETKAPAYEIYKIARNYFLEDYRLDSGILLVLIQEGKHSAKQILYDIPFIHSGYLNIILAAKENGR